MNFLKIFKNRIYQIILWVRKGVWFLKTFPFILSLPKVQIFLFGNEKSQQIYSSLTRPHPKYKIFPAKTLGVALLRVPDSFEAYLKGKERQALRTNRAKAQREGFQYRLFDGRKHFDEILKINSSTPIRQAKPMDMTYLTPEKVWNFVNNHPVLHGVFSKDGTLVAYSETIHCGEVLILSRLLGHASFLEKGIMYLLVSEIVKEAINLKQKEGLPLWIMYDMYFGASPGLKYFKDRLGFEPYKVKWFLKHKNK